jgi:hypothetical protein
MVGKCRFGAGDAGPMPFPTFTAGRRARPSISETSRRSTPTWNAQKLVALFAEEATPAKFKQMVLLFIVVLAGIPALLLVLPRSWWTYAMIPYFLLLQPMIFLFNWQVQSPGFRCDCGEPAYKFMGLLGRSYCYRCSSCARLLRLRD